MIVQTMTHAEVYQELERDREYVLRWLGHRTDEYRRQALKTSRFPAVWFNEYISPRKNQYIFIIKCLKRKFYTNHAIISLAIRRENRGFTVYLCKMEESSIVQRAVFVQHVFDRYAERGNVQKHSLDLIRHFFAQQAGGCIIDNQRLAGRSVRYNGRYHRVLAVNDGVLLGDVEDGIFIARTFITYQMATGLQKEKFTTAKDKLLSLEDEVKYVQERSKKENVF